MMKCLLVYIVTAIMKMQCTQARNCTMSAATVHYVTSCPDDAVSWKEAAKRKNCESLAGVAASVNCVENASEFVYHCVINHFMNATLEVCAPTRYIQAYCVDYNTELAKITENYDAECSAFKPPCPSRYISTDAYKYQGCYDIIKRKTATLYTTKSSIPMEFTNVTPPEKDDSLSMKGVVIIVVPVTLACAAFIIATTVVFVFWIRKLRKQIKNIGKRDQDREMEMKELIGEEVDPENPDLDIATYESPKEDLDDGTQNLAHEGKDTDSLDSTRLKELEDQAKLHLDFHRTFDEYYVETSFFKKIHNCFKDNGIVVIEGPTGCGKTAAATHLLFKYNDLDIGIRILKATKYTDLYQQTDEHDSSVVIYIDDMDIDNSDMPNWISSFEILQMKIKEAEEKQSRKKHQKTRLIVTTFHVPSKFHNLRIFAKEHIIQVPELSRKEKVKILQKQMEYAETLTGIKPDNIDKVFQDKIDDAKTSVGFPLAAQLYAREEKYREKGGEFFENPKTFFEESLRELVQTDKTKSILTALIIVYLRDLFEGDENMPKALENAQLVTPDTCQSVIEHYENLAKELELKIDGISTSANKLGGLFLLKTEKGTYKFCHRLVLDSVSSFLFDSYFETVINHFPLAAIAYETHEFSDYSDEKLSLIVKRLLSEMKSRNLMDVCKCTILKNEKFLKIVEAKLGENEETPEKILTVFDNKHEHLPLMFWAGRNGLLEFSTILTKFVEKYVPSKKYINHYFMLLGEFSASTPKELNESIQRVESSSDIRKKLFSERQSVIRDVISSHRQDAVVKGILSDLIKDKISLDADDKNKRTPLMFAVLCDKERSSTIELLLENSDITKTDTKGYSVFHHCVAADKNDQNCAQILSKLLKAYGKLPEKSRKVLNHESYSGLTVLHRAAIVTKHSRILCMQMLLGFDKNLCKDDSLTDKTGKTPIHNLIKYLDGNGMLVELERLIRTCMLLLCGCSPYAKSTENEKSAWDVLTEDKFGRHQKLIQVIKASPDQTEIIEIINTVLDDVPDNVERCDIPSDLLAWEIHVFSPSLTMLIKKAAQYLSNKSFN